jgi:hypothetical protein
MVKTTESPAQPDPALETRSKALFDASVSDLDARTRSRLRQARHAAVAQARGRSWRVWALPVLASAALASLVVVVLLPVLQSRQQPLTESFAAAEDMTLLMNEESLDLLEDMEFYAWLDDAPEAFDNPAEADHGAS